MEDRISCRIAVGSEAELPLLAIVVYRCRIDVYFVESGNDKGSSTSVVCLAPNGLSDWKPDHGCHKMKDVSEGFTVPVEQPRTLGYRMSRLSNMH